LRNSPFTAALSLSAAPAKRSHCQCPLTASSTSKLRAAVCCLLSAVCCLLSAALAAAALFE
jgi:hypothetical protein